MSNLERPYRRRTLAGTGWLLARRLPLVVGLLFITILTGSCGQKRLLVEVVPVAEVALHRASGIYFKVAGQPVKNSVDRSLVFTEGRGELPAIELGEATDMSVRVNVLVYDPEEIHVASGSGAMVLRPDIDNVIRILVTPPLQFAWTIDLEAHERTMLKKGVVGHTATRLKDGRVLIVGGATSFTLHKQVAPHLEKDGHVSEATYIYDPATGRFESGPNLTVGRAFHTATLLPTGAVLIAGGMGFVQGGLTPITTTAIFDPTADKLVSGPDLTGSRALHKAVALPDGSVLFVGGIHQTVWNPTTKSMSPGHEALWVDQWSPAGRAGMVSEVKELKLQAGEGRFFHQASVFKNGTTIITGGVSISSETAAKAHRSILVIERNSGTWRLRKSGELSRALYDHRSVVLQDGSGNEYMAVMGGRGISGTFRDVTLVANDGQVTNDANGVLSAGRYGFIAARYSRDKILLAGGLNEQGQPVLTAEKVTFGHAIEANPIRNTLKEASGRYAPRAVVGVHGVIMLIGGGKASSGTLTGLSTTELYNPGQTTE